MACNVASRVKTVISAPHGIGSGPYLVGAAPDNYQSFTDAFGSGSTKVFYVAETLQDWETGRGTYNGTTFQVTRDTVLDGSNGPGSPVNWPEADLTMFVDIPAPWFEYLSVDFNSQQLSPHSITANVGMAFGAGGQVSGTNAAVIGRDLVASGSQAFAQGREGQATAENAAAFGWRSVARYPHGLAIAAGQRTAVGDRNGGLITLNASTSSNSPTNLTFGGNFWSIPSNITCGFSGTLTAYQYAGSSGSVGDSHSWFIGGVSKGPSSVILGTLTVTDLGGDAATSGWSVQGSSSGFSPIEVVGESNKDINWTACLILAESG